MKKTMLRNMNEAHQNFPDQRQGFFLWELLAFLQKMLKISLITELSNNVAVVSCAKDVMTFEYIRMVQLFESFYFTLKHAFFRFSLYSSDIDDFDCYFFFGFIVGSFVDNRAEASSDDVLKSIGVVLYFFPKIVVSVEGGIVHSNSIQLFNNILICYLWSITQVILLFVLIYLYCKNKMNDVRFHIERELAIFARKSELSRRKITLKISRNREVERKTRAKEVKRPMSWQEFRRESLTQRFSKPSLYEENQRNQHIKQKKRSKSAFFQRLIEEENIANGMKPKINKKAFTRNWKIQSKMGQKNLIEEHIYRKLSSQAEQGTVGSDLYLQAKTQLSRRRSVFSQEAFKLYKM